MSTVIHDIFNPQISVVAKGLEGKVILKYGGNNLGKTLQSTRMKKPYHLGFENGLNAIAGVPFLPLNNWSDFKKINRQLTNPKTLERAKEMYATIIFDEVYAASKYCQRYICNKFGVETIAEGREGYGLWQEYETEFGEEMDKLIKAGYTLIYIGHTDVDNDTKQIRPKGDKRSMGVVIDNADIVMYLESNGVDEKGKVIKSSAYLAETKKAFARSRFDYIDTYLEEYTAENLEKIVIDAINKQEKAEGVKAVTFVQQKATQTSVELDFDDLYKEVVTACKTLASKVSVDAVSEITKKYLGEGKKLSDCTKAHVEFLSLILIDANEAIEEANEKE